MQVTSFRAYVISFLALAIVVTLRGVLDRWLGPDLPFVTLFGAVALAEWVGGIRPAALVAVLGYAACVYLFTTPRGHGSFDAKTSIGMIAYLLTCTVIVTLGEAMRRAHRHAETRGEEALREAAERKKGEDASRRLQELSTRFIRGGESIESLYENMLDTAVTIMGADLASIHLAVASEDEPVLELAAHRGFHIDSARHWMRVGVHATSAGGRALSRRQRYEVADVEGWADVRNTPELDALRQSGIRAVQSTPLFSRSGNLIGMISTYWREPHAASATELNTFDVLARQIADLIERERSATELRLSEEKFSALFHHSPEALALSVWPVGVIHDVNLAWLKLMGLSSRDQVVGKTTLELGLHQDPATRERIIAEFQERGQVTNAEIAARTSTGKPITVLVNLLPVEFGGQRYVLSTNLDITARKEAEAAVRVSETRLRVATEAAGMFTWEWDLTGRAIRWSRNAADVIGCAPTDLAKEGGNASFFVAPEDRDRMTSEWLEAIAKRRRTFTADFRGAGARDDAKYFMTHVRILYDDQGTALRAFGVTQDITARKRAEQALRAADRRKDEFLATLAHELRNPLAPIRAAVHTFKAKESNDPQLAWVRQVIDRQVSQMARMLDDLLDLNRVSRGKTELLRGRVTLASVLENAVETSGPLVVEHDHQLAIHLPDTPVILDGDALRLAQVFANLLNNAAKYSPPGGRIDVSAEVKGNTVVVSVTDRGNGITAEMLPYVFDMFAQADSTAVGAQSGLGIGLSLAKQLVELHGGSISAHSDGPGRGSRFDVYLPLAPRASDAAPRIAVVGDATIPGSRRILVVDDIRDNADMLGTFIHSQGHAVRVAYGGAEALAAVDTFQPHVALLDLGMPGLDGFETCRRIRDTSRGRDMLVIALTGWGQADDRSRTRDAGFDAHLVKPVDLELLFRTINELLGAAATRDTAS